MNFLNAIKNSIYSPQFYQDIPRKGFWKTLRHFLLFIVVLTVIQAGITVVPIATSFKEGVQNFAYSLVELYPQELVIYIKDGKAESTVEEPYLLSLPEGVVKLWEPGGYENLLVIDTQNSYTGAQMNEYNTIAWLTKDALFVREDEGGISVINLSDVGNLKLDRPLIDSYLAKLMPYAKFLGPIAAIAISLGIYLSYSGRLFYALFFAVVLLILSSVLKLHWTYGQAYKISLYAMTTGMLVEFVLGITSAYHQFSGFPFMFSLITLAVVFINVHSKKPAQYVDSEKENGKPAIKNTMMAKGGV